MSEAAKVPLLRRKWTSHNPNEYNHIVDELLDMKINNSEKKIISRNKELDAYIENEFKKLDKIVHEFAKEEEDKNWDLLNDYFKKILG